MDLSNAPLIERIRRGDSAALADYIQERRLQLLAYISRHLGAALRARIEADDVFQELTLEALRRIAELQRTERDPFGWLCEIAEQRLIDAHRRLFGAQKRSADREVSLGSPGDDTRHSPLVNLLVASMTTPSEAFSRDQREIALAEALARLPEESREALRMRYVEGLATKEIAGRMGKSDGAVRVLLTRSLNRLQSVIEG
ncbi:MAG TPA: sigma-70 family RNA polymerase sigma factor [Planctomycetaceae bacterium]|nr:sigma-70 family RNA polymerase sigma factor [Planctomycetaceae bacterium]